MCVTENFCSIDVFLPGIILPKILTKFYKKRSFD